MAHEEWRDIIGYEGFYQISSLGNVRSLSRTYWFGQNHLAQKRTKDIIMSSRKDKDGYLTVSLSKNGKRKNYKIHRLVAYHFLSNPYNYPEVNHKDECRTNNVYTNLEFCTGDYNIHYGSHIARSIKAQHRTPVVGVSLTNGSKIEYSSINDIKREGKFSSTAICLCCKNKYMSKKNEYKGYVWRYK